jgi:hypothetical protein
VDIVTISRRLGMPSQVSPLFQKHDGKSGSGDAALNS